MKITNSQPENLWKGFKDPTPIEEDPELSQAVFENKDSDACNDVYNPYDVNAQTIESDAILAVSQELDRETKSLGISRSYKHITLPEALLYAYIMDHPNQIISHGSLNVEEARLGTGVLRLVMSIKNKNQVLSFYELEYHYAGLKVRIKQNNDVVGKVSYILRGQKCEEIEGVLYGKKLILDPVWHPSKKGQLREEHFKYHNRRTTLVYQANKKHSTLSIHGAKNPLSMTHQEVKKHKKTRFISKSVKCHNHHFNTSLWFHTAILIPIAGNWVVVK